MGVALASNDSDGSPFTEATLRRRARLEPLIEIHQVKGNSECSAGLLTSDEECNFELLFEPCAPGQDQAGDQPAPGCAVASNFARNALKTGLAVEAEHGVNPFKYGFVGSTDDHKSEGGSTDEATWPGHYFGEIGAAAPAYATPRNNPGGLAGVWAEGNTREAIFDALRRRETFATSGTRIRVRFFGGWSLPAGLHAGRNAGELGRLQLLGRRRSGGAEHDLDRPGFRSRAAGVLLRARAGEPDLPVDDPPRAGRGDGASRRRAGDGEGAGLELADLVHAGGGMTRGLFNTSKGRT